ncbi:MAG: HPF/RaiA family ribosome-associated protein [Coxiellaceae bacterium]|nr:HPF/RaiA family ribosome-associated protein [Coxiellaceae bacterium]
MVSIPLQVTIRDIPQSDAVETRIHEKAEKLEQFCNQIISCHVVAEYSKNHPNHDKVYCVRINLNIPGKQLVDQKEDPNLYVAIADAFECIVRQLNEYNDRRQGDVKTHATVVHGQVVRKFDDRDFGFIEGHDGEEYYFNADSVLHPSFAKLNIGSDVHFIVHIGKEGRQAHRVTSGHH